jgi:hypothetical protein
MNHDIRQQLMDEALVALCVFGRRWPRGLLSKTPIPHAWVGFVETSDGRRRFVPSGEDPRPDEDDQLLLVRNRAIAVPLEIGDCTAECGNRVNAHCEVLLRWAARETDLAALARWILGSRRFLTLDKLAARLADEGATTALKAFMRERSAETLVQEDLRDELLEHLREQLKRFLFDSGAALERVARAEFASDTLAHKQKLEREAAERVAQIRSREMVEHAAAAATSRRLEDLRGLLDKLKTAAAGDDNMRWHELLPALTPAERGRLLENLWRITPDRLTARAIVAVAGDYGLWLDPVHPEAIAKRVGLRTQLGGLRSVCYAPQRDCLLIGAARGVWVLDAAGEKPAVPYEVADGEPPRTGFNAAVILGDALYATHSALGCWRWSLDAPSDARPLLKPEQGTPRSILAATAAPDGRLLLATDSAIRIYSPDADDLSVLCDAGDEVHALSVLDDAVYAGTSRGNVMRVALDGSSDPAVLHRARQRVESVQPRRWSDLVELIIPAAEEGILSVYGDENVVVRLLDSEIPIRRAWACDDVVLGLSDRRDRLIVLNANLPERSGRWALVARQIGHSVQDACIVVDRAQQPAVAQA